MGFDGAPPPDKGAAFATSPKTQQVLDALATLKDRYDEESTPRHTADDLLRALYEPALAVAAAINHVRQGRTGMAPFVGAGGVILSQALEPLVAHFGDENLTFEDAFARIGIPVVPFADLPDVPEVQTPATAREPNDNEAAAEEATWD